MQIVIKKDIRQQKYHYSQVPKYYLNQISPYATDVKEEVTFHSITIIVKVFASNVSVKEFAICNKRLSLYMSAHPPAPLSETKRGIGEVGIAKLEI